MQKVNAYIYQFMKYIFAAIIPVFSSNRFYTCAACPHHCEQRGGEQGWVPSPCREYGHEDTKDKNRNEDNKPEEETASVGAAVSSSLAALLVLVLGLVLVLYRKKIST